MKVKEIMTRTPAICSPESTVQEVARAMIAHDCGAVPVIRGAELAGIITDRDIVVRGVAEGLNPTTLKVASCMTSPAVTIREDATLQDCTELMEAKKIRRVAVVDDRGTLVGILAQADVARHASREDAGELVADVSTPGR